MTEHTVRRTFSVPLSPERVWELVGDTHKVNELVFQTSASAVIARTADKARIRGTFGAIASEYDEYPWEFAVPRRYRSRRVFLRGPLRRFEFSCVLEPESAGTIAALTATVECAPGMVGSAFGRLFARRLEVGLQRLETLVRRQAPHGAVVWRFVHPHADAVRARARPLVDAIRPTLSARQHPVLDRLVEHVATMTDADVARMRPYALAASFGADRRDTLVVFLRATQAGLLRLSWDVLCPACEGSTTVASLKDLPDGGHCPSCDIDFRTDFDRNVEATFRPEPAVRPAERLVFCHGSPASTPSWLAQFVVPPRATQTLTTRLGPGRYRLLGQGIGAPLLIDVDDNASLRSVRATVEHTGGGSFSATSTQIAPGECDLVVDNPHDTPRRIQLAWRAFATDAATAADVTGLGLYQELFGAEVLSPSQHVAVGQRTILFTDLVGSTALYERVGDAAAYGMVRRHFALLEAEVERCNGHVVKTVGDAVMAAFDLPIDGVRAGWACIEALRTLVNVDGSSTGLRLRVGVHAGPCLAVDANQHVDYFGRTVNVAARVESLGGPDELVLSWTVRAAEGVPALLDELRRGGHAVVDDRQRVKGVAEPVDITRVAVRSGGA
jgi:class 3 adenylate cyclase